MKVLSECPRHCRLVFTQKISNFHPIVWLRFGVLDAECHHDGHQMAEAHPQIAGRVINH